MASRIIESHCARQFLAFAFIFGKNPQLGVCRSALQNDRAALFRLLAAGECFGIRRGQFQNATEQVANCDRAGSRCKSALCAIALSAPFVFHSNSAIDYIDTGIVFAMGV